MKTRFIVFFLSVAVGLFFVPLLLRTLAADSLALNPSIMDMRASAVDFLIVAVILFIFSFISGGLNPIITAVVIALFGLITLCNMEFVRVFGEPIEFRQAGYLFDPTFFFGSAIRVSTPWVFAVYGAVVAGVIWSAKSLELDIKRKMFLSAAVGCSILLLLPNNSNTAAWRELSVLQHSSQSFFNAVNGRQEYHAALEISAEAFAEVERSLKHDVDGVSLINEPLNKPNILLIVLESVAGPFLPSIALQHGVDSDVKMRNLDEFSKRGLSYSRFMTHQVQTMRGTYAMLCGDLPRFSFEMPKLEVAALSGNRLRCLPQVLKDHGYSTNYLQAAPLSYSNKDTALPLIGYDVAQGAEWFGKDLVGAGWGVGDDALFQEALKRVSSLNDKDQPWFLTVLNVGTHHPFDQVPSSFVGSSDQKTRSFEYLDYELGKFINQLSDRRDLSNTLIVITSDEAGGLMGRGTPAVQKLARNLGTMTMVHPSLPSRRIDDVFGQIDFATTIVDLLGITGETQFQGRSAFREYIKPRKIFAFHNYGGTLFELSQNMVVMCTVEISKCEWFEMPGGQLGKLSQTSSKNDIPSTMLAALELSEPRVPDVEFKLMEEDQQFTIEDDGAYVFCCQYMKLAGNRSLLIDLHIEFEPEIDGVALHFDVVSNKNGVFTTHYQKTEQANSAGSFVLRKRLRFTKDIEEVEVRMHVDGASKLVSKRAILQVQSF